MAITERSPTQAAECVGLKVQNVSDFLHSKAVKALAGEGYTPQIPERGPALIATQRTV